jgi:serine/threonine-protein kinase
MVQAWMDYPHKEGTIVGRRYSIVQVLGEGSYGITYVCQDLQQDHLVVVKQAKPSKGILARTMLGQERHILTQLHHPQIPQCLDRIEGKRGELLYLVVEYIRGETVEQSIFDRGKVVSEQQCLEFMLKLMDIVQYIHSQGIIHLDIRIPNVIQREHEMYLIDYGLAARIGSTYNEDDEADEETKLRRTPIEASDLYAIGHFMLFMLYSSYSSTLGSPPVSWQEELPISFTTKQMIRRLLQIELCYESSEQFISDIRKSLQLLAF